MIRIMLKERETRSAPTRRAFTLVEVVAGLTLLTVLLTGVLSAFAMHRRQLYRAQDRIAATRLADQLLTDWTSHPEGIPRQGAGLATNGDWSWTLRPIGFASIAGASVEVVRCEVFKMTSGGAKPACSVDVVRRTSAIGGAAR